MARPIEYDRENVLDRALLAFWRMGHAACSVEMLVQETGMSRQGLYNTFGDKNALFLAVIDHYKTLVDRQLRPLADPQANLHSIRTFISSSLSAQAQAGPGACFLVITAFGEKSEDPDINAAVRDGADMVRRAFERVLSRLTEQGEIRPDIDASDAAGYLYCVMSGISALARTGGTQSQCDSALDVAMRSLLCPDGAPT